MFSSADNLFYQRAQQGLFPTTTYGSVSGGDPTAIPDLTYEQLVDFHGKFYHPSNARFFSYGDLPLEEHLATVNALVLDQFGPRDNADTAVPDEVRWTSPRALSGTCGLDAVGGDVAATNGRISVSYLLAPVTDTFAQIALRIVTTLLTDGPNAPFFKSLLETKLGSDYACNTGMSSSTRETSFAVGLQGNCTRQRVWSIHAQERQGKKITTICDELTLDNVQQSILFQRLFCPCCVRLPKMLKGWMSFVAVAPGYAVVQFLDAYTPSNVFKPETLRLIVFLFCLLVNRRGSQQF